MKQNNRVLARRGARELTLDEIDHVTGGSYHDKMYIRRPNQKT